MKSSLDYLNLDDSERRFFRGWESLPDEVLPLFEKMLNGTTAEFEEAEAQLLAIYEQRKQQ